jgi:ankyrin repeat protein
MACLLEKRKAAELLLEFGANPIALNAYGQTPVQMVPASAVPSNKLYFRKLFQVRVSETIVCVIDV